MLYRFLPALLVSMPLQAQAPLNIRLAAGTEAEAAVRDQLLRLVREYDIDRWILTREVIIDQTQTPHSHPVLTLHTRHRGDDMHLLSTFLHEQFHWMGTDTTGRYDLAGAIADMRQLYPEVPVGRPNGGRDERSTWLHLVVCDLEYQAMSILLGEARAREVLEAWDHYQWIYDRVLNDPRIREINLRHGFTVSR